MAIVIGLIGVMVILQPSLIIFGWPAVLPMITALAMACYVALTRRLAGQVHPYQMQMMVGFSATATLGFVLLIGPIFGSLGQVSPGQPATTYMGRLYGTCRNNRPHIYCLGGWQRPS